MDLANWTPRPAALIYWRVNPALYGRITSSISGSMVVFDGGAVDERSQFIEGSGGNTCSLSSPGLKSSLLSGGLIEPNFHVSLPMFAKVHVGEDVVVLDH